MTEQQQPNDEPLSIFKYAYVLMKNAVCNGTRKQKALLVWQGSG